MTVDRIESLPLFDVDENFDTQQDFYFSLYQGDRAVHVNLTKAQEELKWDNATIPLDFKLLENELHVNLDGKTTMISRVQKFNLKYPVRSVSLSPDGSWIAIGGENGRLGIYDAAFQLKVECYGHKSDITFTKFFPSGQVLLSGSIDMSLKVWGMDGSNPVTLIGHIRAITDAEMIERGKLILSSSLDGTVKLWHIATSSVLHTFTPTNNTSAGVNVIKVSTCSWLNSSNLPCKEDPESDLTRNKLLICGTTDGMLYGYDIFERNLLFSVNVYNDISIKSLDFSINFQKIWIGLENGVIGSLSLKQGFEVKAESFHRRTQAPAVISHLPCEDSPCLWLCGTDGSCALWSFEDDHILKELAIGTTQTCWVYGFQENLVVAAGSSGIIYMMKV